MRTPITIQQTSNHGTANPIVARLVIQTTELIQWLDVTSEERDGIVGQYFELKRRLLNCFDIHQRLIDSNTTTLKNFDDLAKLGKNTMPYVIGLQDEVENFLFSVKVYLRELARLLNILFKAKLPVEAAIFWDPKGRECKAVTWAKHKFGEHDETARMLAFDASWIGEIVRKRNAVEHPEGNSGTLSVTNYERVSGGFAPPIWARDGANPAPPSDIYNDIEATMENLLTLAEDLLIKSIHAAPLSPLIKFALIPEDKRDHHAPVRLRATMDASNF